MTSKIDLIPEEAFRQLIANSNSYNDFLKNLRLLCLNCHTQTKTYGSKRGTKLE